MTENKFKELWPGELNNRCSSLHYPLDWENRKQFIREKYKYICQNCGINLENDSEFLDVHHTYSIPDKPHHLDSLILLCCLCHSQVSKKGLNHELMLLKGRVKAFINKYDFYLEKNNPYRKNYNSAFDMIGDLLGYNFAVEMKTKNLYPVDRNIQGKGNIIWAQVEVLTKKAVLILYQNRHIWLPLRHIGIDLDEVFIGKMIEVEIPDWLYKKEF